LDRPQPAGTYALETIEDELPDFSFAVFRRTATMLRLPALSSTGCSSEVFCVDPEELAAALASDRLKESQ
jgi:hypothetical protein